MTKEQTKWAKVGARVRYQSGDAAVPVTRGTIEKIDGDKIHVRWDDDGEVLDHTLWAGSVIYPLAA